MLETSLKKKYGLPTAIAMVVGTVIGSGVFFKAEKILNATGGNLPLGILAWIIGGAIMLICSYVFAIMATRFEYVNGIVDYSEVTMGKKYAYYVGWFMSIIYYPTLTSALAWVSARYTCVLFGYSIVGPEAMTITALYLVASFVVNSLSPVLAGKFQVAATTIKLIPLYLMAIIGTIVGLVNGLTIENFTTVVKEVSTGNALFTAVVATAFAYEGWIVATSINAELRDSKKNLPIALVVGALIVIATYILYYIGLAGAVTNAELMESGEAGAKLAFRTVFSNIGGTLLFVFVVISCLGTLNGLMMGCVRGLYSLAARKIGPRPDVFEQVDNSTNVPNNSAIIGLLLCVLWIDRASGTDYGQPARVNRLLRHGVRCFHSDRGRRIIIPDCYGIRRSCARRICIVVGISLLWRNGVWRHHITRAALQRNGYRFIRLALGIVYMGTISTYTYWVSPPAGIITELPIAS